MFNYNLRNDILNIENNILKRLRIEHCEPILMHKKDGIETWLHTSENIFNK